MTKGKVVEQKSFTNELLITKDELCLHIAQVWEVITLIKGPN